MAFVTGLAPARMKPQSGSSSVTIIARLKHHSRRIGRLISPVLPLDLGDDRRLAELLSSDEDAAGNGEEIAIGLTAPGTKPQVRLQRRRS